MSRRRADHAPRLGPLAKHVFVEDPAVPPDGHGRRYCGCGLSELHERHALPAMTDDMHAAEDRRYGQRGDT